MTKTEQETLLLKQIQIMYSMIGDGTSEASEGKGKTTAKACFKIRKKKCFFIQNQLLKRSQFSIFIIRAHQLLKAQHL